MKETILVTGGEGFIGSNFIRYILDRGLANILNLDALTYAGNPENLADLSSNDSYCFIHGSITNSSLVEETITKYGVTGIINFAAESHVDRSILNAQPFIDTNIKGTLVLLEAARKHQLKKYLQISTDEVYGSLGPEGKFTEETPVDPKSPYSASKAGADHLVLAFSNTYGLPVVITRCSNNYGPYQFPEKLIPLMILNALEDKPLPVYGDGMNVRDWIHVGDHCSAIWMVYNKGGCGEVYNVGGNSERTNIDIVKQILGILNKPESLIKYVTDRPGHDRRYAIDSKKIETNLGWKREIDFETGLYNTVQWYISNPGWCARIRSGAYMDYYKTQYGV